MTDALLCGTNGRDDIAMMTCIVPNFADVNNRCSRIVQYILEYVNHIALFR